MAGLARLKKLSAKIETTEGSDAMTTVGTADANTDIKLRNPSLRINAEEIDLDFVVAHISSLGKLVGKTSAELSFETPIMGMAAIPTSGAPLRIDPLFRAAGHQVNYVASTSARYDPISSSIPSVTLYYHLDPGLLFILVGCRGNLAAAGSAGQVGYFKWRFQGTFAALQAGVFSSATRDAVGIQDVALTAASLEAVTTNPPLWLNRNSGLSFDLHGAPAAAEVWSDFEFDYNNQLAERTDATNANGQGIAGFLIGKRTVTGKVNPELVQRTTYDPWYEAQNGSTGNINLTVGATSGNRYKFTAATAQLLYPQPEDRNNLISAVSIPFVCKAGSGAGNNECKHEFD